MCTPNKDSCTQYIDFAGLVYVIRHQAVIFSQKNERLLTNKSGGGRESGPARPPLRAVVQAGGFCAKFFALHYIYVAQRASGGVFEALNGNIWALLRLYLCA